MAGEHRPDQPQERGEMVAVDEGAAREPFVGQPGGRVVVPQDAQGRKQDLRDAVQGLRPGQREKEPEEPVRKFRGSGIERHMQQRGENSEEEPPGQVRPRGQDVVTDSRPRHVRELKQSAGPLRANRREGFQQRGGQLDGLQQRRKQHEAGQGRKTPGIFSRSGQLVSKKPKAQTDEEKTGHALPNPGLGAAEEENQQQDGRKEQGSQGRLAVRVEPGRRD